MDKEIIIKIIELMPTFFVGIIGVLAGVIANILNNNHELKKQDRAMLNQKVENNQKVLLEILKDLNDSDNLLYEALQAQSYFDSDKNSLNSVEIKERQTTVRLKFEEYIGNTKDFYCIGLLNILGIETSANKLREILRTRHETINNYLSINEQEAEKAESEFFKQIGAIGMETLNIFKSIREEAKEIGLI